MVDNVVLMRLADTLEQSFPDVSEDFKYNKRNFRERCEEIARFALSQLQSEIETSNIDRAFDKAMQQFGIF